MGVEEQEDFRADSRHKPQAPADSASGKDRFANLESHSSSQLQERFRNECWTIRSLLADDAYPAEKYVVKAKEIPSHLSQPLEVQPDPALHHDEAQPEPVPCDEAQPEPVPCDEAQPEPVPCDEAQPEHVPCDEAQLEHVPHNQAQPEPTPRNEAEPEHVSCDEAQPEPTPCDEAQPEPTPCDEAQLEQAPRDEPQLEPTPCDEAQLEQAPHDEAQPEPVPHDKAQPEPTPRNETQPEQAPRDEAQPEPVPRDETQPEQAPRDEAQPEPAPHYEMQPEHAARNHNEDQPRSTSIYCILQCKATPSLCPKLAISVWTSQEGLAAVSSGDLHGNLSKKLSHQNWQKIFSTCSASGGSATIIICGNGKSGSENNKPGNTGKGKKGNSIGGACHENKGEGGESCQGQGESVQPLEASSLGESTDERGVVNRKNEPDFKVRESVKDHDELVKDIEPAENGKRAPKPPPDIYCLRPCVQHFFSAAPLDDFPLASLDTEPNYFENEHDVHVAIPLSVNRFSSCQHCFSPGYWKRHDLHHCDSDTVHVVVPFSVRVDLQQCTMPVYLCSTEMEMMENGAAPLSRLLELCVADSTAEHVFALFCALLECRSILRGKNIPFAVVPSSVYVDIKQRAVLTLWNFCRLEQSCEEFIFFSLEVLDKLDAMLKSSRPFQSSDSLKSTVKRAMKVLSNGKMNEKALYKFTSDSVMK